MWAEMSAWKDNKRDFFKKKKKKKRKQALT